MFNVSIAGRLTRDAEYKKVGAYDLAEFTIAVSHPRDETSFIKCQVWGKRYESILDAYKKGCLVCVSGNAKYTEYTTEFTNKEGETKQNTTKSLQVSVNEFIFPEKRQQQTPTLETADIPF